jgi:DNA-binding NtrC family response regulator
VRAMIYEDLRPYWPDRELDMKSREPQRKILIIETEAGVLNLAHILLESMGCLCTDAVGAAQALQMLRRRSFDAVLLDMHFSDDTPAEVISGIQHIQPQLIGRVLVINGDARDRKTMDFIESNCFATVPRSRILLDLWSCLQRLFAAPQYRPRAA